MATITTLDPTTETASACESCQRRPAVVAVVYNDTRFQVCTSCLPEPAKPSRQPAIAAAT